MKYQYKVIHESQEKNLETELNVLGHVELAQYGFHPFPLPRSFSSFIFVP